MADNNQPKAANGKNDGQMNNEFNFAIPAAPPTRGRKRRNTAEELLKKIARQSASPQQEQQQQQFSQPAPPLAYPADFVKNTISIMPGLEEDQREMLKQIVDIKAENARHSEGRLVDLNKAMFRSFFGKNIPSKPEPPILRQVFNPFAQQHSLGSLITTEQMANILRTQGLGANYK